MKPKATPRQEGNGSNLTRKILRRAIQVILLVAVQAAVLFLSSGDASWRWAWIYIGIYLAAILINGSFMIQYSPETIAERSEAGENWKTWDKIIGGLFALCFFVINLLIAGLDVRYGWSEQMPLTIRIVAIITFMLGFALFSWSMISNAYFSTVVRIQEEREHNVCNTGPYQYLRHPGYLGGILQSLAAPLLLGSLWALIPAGVGAVLLIVRTALEDRTLIEELGGYRDYATQVRYRLLPKIW